MPPVSPREECIEQKYADFRHKDNSNKIWAPSYSQKNDLNPHIVQEI